MPLPGFPLHRCPTGRQHDLITEHSSRRVTQPALCAAAENPRMKSDSSAWRLVGADGLFYIKMDMTIIRRRKQRSHAVLSVHGRAGFRRFHTEGVVP